jgi:cytochrome c-type biogenesis protein CcmH
MTWVAVIAVLLTLVTVWYMARPLMRPFFADDRERRDEYEQLRDRLLIQLNELDLEEGDRNIDTAVVSDERRRLEAELAEALRELEALGTGRKTKTGKKEGPEIRRGWIIIIVVVSIILPLSAAGLYTLNQRQALSYLLNPEATSNASVPPMVLEMLARLEKHLAEQPDDAAGWFRLGRAYVVLGRPEAAATAYERAYKLTPNDTHVIAEYAAFLYNSDPRNTAGQVFNLYTQLLKLEPENLDALWFLGFAGYQQGNYQLAVNYWERLLKDLPADSPDKEHLRTIINKTREKLATKS